MARVNASMKWNLVFWIMALILSVAIGLAVLAFSDWIQEILYVFNPYQ